MKKLEESTSNSWIEEVLSAPEVKFYTAKELEDYCKKVLNDIGGHIK